MEAKPTATMGSGNDKTNGGKGSSNHRPRHGRSDGKKHRGHNRKENRKDNHKKHHNINHKDNNKQLDEPAFHIFCDMDGVLCDFDRGVQALCGQTPDELDNLKEMWKVVARKRNFFQTLDWMSDGQELWDALRAIRKVDILTGVPSNQPNRHGYYKSLWCIRELDRGYINHVDMAAQHPQRHDIVTGRKQGRNVNVISCWSKFKWKECRRPTDILIDDRLSAREPWEQAGGIFVHHTSTATTLVELRRLGVLQPLPASSEPGPQANLGEQQGQTQAAQQVPGLPTETTQQA